MTKPRFVTKKLLTEQEVIDHIKAFTKAKLLDGISRKEYHYNYKVICSTLFINGRHLKENLEVPHITSGKEFLKILDSLDQFNSLNIDIGSKVSIISAQLQGNYVELWGFLTPKTITNIHYENELLRQVEFNNDPTDVYPREDNIEYKGEPLFYSAFFDSKNSAEKALTWLTLNYPSSLKIVNNITENLKENEMSNIMKGLVNENDKIKGADGKACWKGYKRMGTKKKGGKTVDNCVPIKNESAYEADLDDNEPRIVSGVYGAKSKEFRKKFANQQAQDRFFDHPDREGNFEIHYVEKANMAEASGTPGGIEMFRTPAMVNTTMQQNLYKRELAPIKAAEKKRKEAEYRKNNPSVSVPKIQIGASTYPIPVIQNWIDTKDLNAALEFAVNKFAHKQSKDFKTELAGDPNFQKVVKNFFNVAEKSLNDRNSTRTKSPWDGKIRSAARETDISAAGFDAINKINDVLLPYYKKYGVDKTGRRVPPGFNYNLGEGVITQHDAKDPEVAIIGGAGTMSLSRLKKKAQGEAEQLANDLTRGLFKAAAYNIKQLENTLKTIAAAEDEMEKGYFGENAWNQLGQRRPGKNLPAPARGSVPKHGRHFEEGDIVIPMSGPMSGEPHRVVHSQRTSIRIVPLGRNSYPGDIIGPRTKHEWVVPADTNEDFTGQFAAERTAETNPYGGMKDHQNRGMLGEDDLDEARPMSPALRAAQKNMAGLASGEVQRREAQRKAAEKAQRQASKDLDRMLNRKPAKKSKQDLETLWAKIESVIANSFPDGEPYDQLWPYMQKNGFTQDDVERASKMNGYDDLWDYWNTLTQDIENDAYADWLATGGKNVRTRGQFVEEEQLDEKCWTGYKKVGMKKKGDKQVPNCVKKESSVMRGLTR